MTTWALRKKVYVLTVSTDDETYYTDVASMDKEAIKRIRKMLADDFETEEGGDLDLGDREIVLISNEMTDTELREIAEATAEEAGEYSGTAVPLRLCLVTPWDGSELLCKLPYRHVEAMHVFVFTDDYDLRGHEFPREAIWATPPEDQEAALRDLATQPPVVAPGQVGLFE